MIVQQLILSSVAYLYNTYDVYVYLNLACFVLATTPSLRNHSAAVVQSTQPVFLVHVGTNDGVVIVPLLVHLSGPTGERSQVENNFRNISSYKHRLIGEISHWVARRQRKARLRHRGVNKV